MEYFVEKFCGFAGDAEPGLVPVRVGGWPDAS